MQLARQLKEEFSDATVVVLSCDYDFLALAPPDSGDALLDPTRNIILWKRDVLIILNVDEKVLFIAYTIAGCDDISTNLQGVGFKRAFSFASHNVMLDSVLEEFDEFEKKDLISLCGEIQALQGMLWDDEAVYLECFQQDDERSMLEKFAVEEDEHGSLRRPGFHTLYFATVCENFIDPLDSLVKNTTASQICQYYRRTAIFTVCSEG